MDAPNSSSTGPENSTSALDHSTLALPDLSPAIVASYEDSHSLRYPVATSSPLLRMQTSGPTADFGFGLQKKHQTIELLQNACRSELGSLPPPYIPLLVESAEKIAASASHSWEMLYAELECQRAVFKFCCTSREFFDDTMFRSYCNRLRLIHNSLCCGMLVALRALLDQLRVWLQVGAVTTDGGQPLSQDNGMYRERLGQLIVILQQLELNTNAVRFPDAVTLSHDTSLMREIYVQHGGEEAPSTPH
jgi:hypothetical protein